jgi:AraC-like DNA-binding protein
MQRPDSPVHGNTGLASLAQLFHVDRFLTTDSPMVAWVVDHSTPTPMTIEYHVGFEVGVVLTGEHERQSSAGRAKTGPGDVWLLSMWEPHGWRIAKRRTSDVTVVFLPDFLGEEDLEGISWLSLFAASPDQRPRAATSRARGKILALAQQMKNEVEQKEPGWHTAVRLDLLRILLELSRQWDRRGFSHQHLHTSTSNLARIVPAIELVHEQPARRVRIAEAAASCGFSPTHFKRIFRGTMGVRFGQFALRTRLAMAAQRLLTTNESQEVIAAEAGFFDASHLHRSFVKHYGCSPGTYRREAT